MAEVTPERLAEIEGRVEAAPRRPWTGDRVDGTVKYHLLSSELDEDGDPLPIIRGCNGNEDPPYGILSDEAEALIKHAPDDLADLCAAIREAWAELANERGEGEPPSEGWASSNVAGCHVSWAKRLDPMTVAHVAGYDLGRDWNVRIVRLGKGLIWFADNIASARRAMRAADEALAGQLSTRAGELDENPATNPPYQQPLDATAEPGVTVNPPAANPRRGSDT